MDSVGGTAVDLAAKLKAGTTTLRKAREDIGVKPMDCALG